MAEGWRSRILAPVYALGLSFVLVFAMGSVLGGPEADDADGNVPVTDTPVTDAPVTDAPGTSAPPTRDGDDRPWPGEFRPGLSLSSLPGEPG